MLGDFLKTFFCHFDRSGGRRSLKKECRLETWGNLDGGPVLYRASVHEGKALQSLTSFVTDNIPLGSKRCSKLGAGRTRPGGAVAAVSRGLGK